MPIPSTPTPTPTPAPKDHIDVKTSGTRNNWRIEILRGPIAIDQSDLPKSIEFVLTTKGHNKFLDELDEAELGFKSAVLSKNSKNVKVLKQEERMMQLEITDSNFYIDIENIDTHHPAGGKVKI